MFWYQKLFIREMPNCDWQRPGLFSFNLCLCSPIYCYCLNYVASTLLNVEWRTFPLPSQPIHCTRQQVYPFILKNIPITSSWILPFWAGPKQPQFPNNIRHFSLQHIEMLVKRIRIQYFKCCISSLHLTSHLTITV